MTRVGMTRRLRRFAIVLSAIGLAGPALIMGHGQAAAPDPSAPAVHDSGMWDLAFERGNRRCRLFLRSEARAGGYAVAVPAVCHHAFPILAAVTNWSSGEDEHVLLRNEAGIAVLDFAPNGTAALSTVVGEGDLYQFMPADAALQEAVRMAAPEARNAGATVATSGAAPAAPTSAGVVVERSAGNSKGVVARQATAMTPSLPPVSAAEVAGNYAVLRKEHDTGCMVTLEPAGGRARLAPACRDQGIVIFDPTTWQLTRGELVLKAKRGHTTVLTRRDAKTWANAPASGAALVLKRL